MVGRKADRGAELNQYNQVTQTLTPEKSWSADCREGRGKIFLPEGLYLREQLLVGRNVERGALVSPEKQVVETLAPKKAKPPDCRMGIGCMFARKGPQ